MRGFSLLELLVVIVAAGILISTMFYWRWEDTEKDLRYARARETATRELWMIRMDAPNQDFWMWTDENGIEWILSGSSNRVIELGESKDG